MLHNYQVNILKERVEIMIAHVRHIEKWHDRQFAAGKAEGILEALYHMDAIGYMELHRYNEELINALHRD